MTDCVTVSVSVSGRLLLLGWEGKASADQQPGGGARGGGDQPCYTTAAPRRRDSRGRDGGRAGALGKGGGEKKGHT